MSSYANETTANTSYISTNQDTSSSTCTEQQAASISLIITKLGHGLQEIRTRALDSLISKLTNHVITEGDLVQQKQLFIRLFELFNFPGFDQHEAVLDLLLNLSKHTSAARNIQDISGLQFLNALMADLKDEALKTKVEQIIENLMRTLGIGIYSNENSMAPASSTLAYNSGKQSGSTTPRCSESSLDATPSSHQFSFKNPTVVDSGSSDVSTIHSFMNNNVNTK
jgi:hypothetical protein